MKKMLKGQIVVVKNILGETVLPLIERLDNHQYRFKVDAWCVGETCKGGFFHLRQAIEAKPDKKITEKVNFWPRLRSALHKAGAKPVNIPGGDNPLHYEDQMAVADFCMSGAHFFIIERADIKKYLDLLPLDEVGKQRRKTLENIKKIEKAEAYRQKHDPHCIARRIGDEIFEEGLHNPEWSEENAEFFKFTFIEKDKSEFSVIYPLEKTNLVSGADNVAKVVCIEPEITGIKYLSGLTAGKIDPRQHYRIRIKKEKSGWNENVAFLMPLAGLATEIRENRRYNSLFYDNDHDGIDVSLIAEAEQIVLESFDLYDRIYKKRLVYKASSGKVFLEKLINNPQSILSREFFKTPIWAEF